MEIDYASQSSYSNVSLPSKKSLDDIALSSGLSIGRRWWRDADPSTHNLEKFCFLCPPVDKHFRTASEIIFKPMQKFARNTELFFKISKKFQIFGSCFRKFSETLQKLLNIFKI
jgi:hypothetical protein